MVVDFRGTERVDDMGDRDQDGAAVFKDRDFEGFGFCGSRRGGGEAGIEPGHISVYGY